MELLSIFRVLTAIFISFSQDILRSDELVTLHVSSCKTNMSQVVIRNSWTTSPVKINFKLIKNLMLGISLQSFLSTLNTSADEVRIKNVLSVELINDGSLSNWWEKVLEGSTVYPPKKNRKGKLIKFYYSTLVRRVFAGGPSRRTCLQATFIKQTPQWTHKKNMWFLNFPRTR